MPSAADEVAAAIAESGGAIRFDRFVECALYGREGFYSSGGRAGRRGDFITSPEVGPLFGTVLSRWIDAEFRRLGCPDDFVVIDAGAGPGTLGRAVTAEWRSRAASPYRYLAVEISAEQRGSHPDGVESLPTMPTDSFVGVVVANELLDNLPFRLLVFDGGWREAHVAHHGDRLVEVLVPLESVPAWLPATAPHGARVPWHEAAHRWVSETLARIDAGTLLVIDYVTATTAELAAMPWRSWLRTYRGHERGRHYLADVGGQDVTTQVALDQLPVPDTIRTQQQFLQLWGIDDLVDEGRTAWEAAAARPDLAALRMRSRVREADALLDPAGLGGFLVLEYRCASADGELA
ncbi:MAG: hypothetical protein RI958_1120 [Actinomycetota bacterium]